MSQNFYHRQMKIKKTLEESSVQIKEDKRLELAGAWADFPDLDSIRGTRVADVKREVL